MAEWVRYELLDENGVKLGPLLSPTASWTAGAVVHRGASAAYEVVRVVDAEAGDGVDAFLVVRAAP